MKTFLLSLFLFMSCSAGPAQEPRPLALQDSGSFINFVVKVDIYRNAVLFIVSSDIPRSRDFINSVVNEKVITVSDFAGRDGFTYEPAEGFIIVWLERAPQNFETRGIVNHELFHATSSILRRAGVTLTESSEEAYAYLFQEITSQFYSFLTFYESQPVTPKINQK